MGLKSTQRRYFLTSSTDVLKSVYALERSGAWKIISSLGLDSIFDEDYSLVRKDNV